MAWLAAVPVTKDGELSESRYDMITRQAELDNVEPDYNLPDANAGAYLLGYLQEIGEAEQSGNGLIPVGWQTVEAWSRMTGIRLSPPEALAIRRLSAAYCSQYYAAQKPDCQSPCFEVTEDHRARVADQIQSAFRMLRSSKNGR